MAKHLPPGWEWMDVPVHLVDIEGLLDQPSAAADPATRAVQRVSLLEAFKTLTPRQFRVAYRRLVEDAEYEEIQDELGISHDQARQDLSRARAQLRQELAGLLPALVFLIILSLMLSLSLIARLEQPTSPWPLRLWQFGQLRLGASLSPPTCSQVGTFAPSTSAEPVNERLEFMVDDVVRDGLLYTARVRIRNSGEVSVTVNLDRSRLSFHLEGGGFESRSLSWRGVRTLQPRASIDHPVKFFLTPCRHSDGAVVSRGTRYAAAAVLAVKSANPYADDRMWRTPSQVVHLPGYRYEPAVANAINCELSARGDVRGAATFLGHTSEFGLAPMAGPGGSHPPGTVVEPPRQDPSPGKRLIFMTWVDGGPRDGAAPHLVEATMPRCSKRGVPPQTQLIPYTQ